MSGLRLFFACVVAAATVVAPAVQAVPATAREPVSAIDPSRSGRFTVDQLDYEGGHVVLQDREGTPVVEELKGSIHLPDADGGPWPLVVFVHGRYPTCSVADGAHLESVSPCPELNPVTSGIPSYRGYDYLAHNLASHGYVVVSVSANGINSYDFPLSLLDSGVEWRAQLVGETLDLMAEWNAMRGPGEVHDRLIGTIDLERIGLMGHSRGGEGVARFVLSNQTRTTGPTYEGLRAVFALAPTDFYREKVPGVHFGTLVPLCDGDVYNLQGARMFDDNRFVKPRRFDRVQLAVEGANHTFFNTVWTIDDAEHGRAGTGSNAACVPQAEGNVRLTAREQRRIGLDLMAAFFRRYLGNETKLQALMNGSGSIPRRHCPRRCDRVVQTSYVGPGARVVVEPDRRTIDKLRTRGRVEVSACRPDLSGDGCPTAPNRSPVRQLTVAWDGRGTVTIPLGGLDAVPYEALTFRAAVNFRDARNPLRTSQAFWVRLVDGAGRAQAVRADRFSRALLPPAGYEHRQILLNGVRIPMSRFRQVDVAKLDRIELLFGDSVPGGSIQLAELAFQDPRPR